MTGGIFKEKEIAIGLIIIVTYTSHTQVAQNQV